MLKRDLITTVLIQAVGAVATIGVTMVVARRFGPEGQGFWASFKSIHDFVAVLAAFGFPTSFAYLINVRKVSDAFLVRFSLLYCAAMGPFLMLLLGLAWMSDRLQLASTTPRLELAMLAIAGTLVAAHAMLRGLMLASTSTAAFNGATILPPVLLLALVLWAPLASHEGLMELAVATAALSLAVCLVLWWKARRATAAHTTKLDLRELFQFGGWIFLASVAAIALPIVTFQALHQVPDSKRVIGWLSVAVLVQGAALTPGNMLGPLLFNTWSKEADASQRRSSYVRLTRLIVLGSSLLSVLLACLLPILIPLIVGPGFNEAIHPALILLAAVPFGYVARLVFNVLLAAGAARTYALAVGAKLFLVSLIMYQGNHPSMDMAAWAWLAGEVLSILVCATALVRSHGWSWSQTLGFRSNSNE